MSPGRRILIFKENAELNNTVATIDAQFKWDSVTSNEQALNLVYAALRSSKMSTVRNYFYVTKKNNLMFKENAELNNTVATIDARGKYNSVNL